jgi:hypothetical protein
MPHLRSVRRALYGQMASGKGSWGFDAETAAGYRAMKRGGSHAQTAVAAGSADESRPLYGLRLQNFAGDTFTARNGSMDSTIAAGGGGGFARKI